MTITISTPGYHSAIGGAIVLHKLGYLLREMGIDVNIWMWGGVGDNPYNFPLTLEAGDVCIYPSLHPLDAPQLVRWCLNEPSRVGAGPAGPDEIIFYFWDYFAPEGSENILTVLELQDCWQDHRERRNGYCYSLRKGGEIGYVGGAVDVGNVGDYQRLAETFNKHKYFYTNDDRTFLSQQAAMCGCISVVDSPGNAEEWRRRMPINEYGVAFGWSADELRHADETKHLVRGNIEDIQTKTGGQIEWLMECIK